MSICISGTGVRNWDTWGEEGDHVCLYRLEERGRRGWVMTVPVGRGRFLDGLGKRRDGRSSYAAVPVCVDDGTGVNMGWVRDTGVTEARLCSVALEALGVTFGGVPSSVNQMGWYRLRARVARMRWRICRCVWSCLIIFHTMCGA